MIFAMAAAAPSGRRWIFGPGPDLLLGCGLGYALVALLLPLAPPSATTCCAGACSRPS
jgi:hypothetical protein